MILGIDVDDVLLDTLETAWLPVFNQLTNSDVKKSNITDWDIAKFVKPQYNTFIYRVLNMDKTWERVKRVKASYEYLKRLNDDKDIDLYIVSATNSTISKEKWKAFERLFPFIKQEQIILIKNKKLLKLDLLVDDNPKNLSKGDILFNQPHNEKYKGDFYRCYSWQEVYNKIMELKEEKYEI